MIPISRSGREDDPLSGGREEGPLLGGLDWEQQPMVLVELEHVPSVGDLISPHPASELEHSDCLEMGGGS